MTTLTITLDDSAATPEFVREVLAVLTGSKAQLRIDGYALDGILKAVAA